MTTKLTLTLDKGVIERTKRYVKAKDTSLSRMVENYFIKVTADEINDLAPDYNTSTLPPITAQLAGLGRNQDDEPIEDYEDALYEALKEKYLK